MEELATLKRHTKNHCTRKLNFPLRISSINVTKSVTFTEETLENFNFCAVNEQFSISAFVTESKDEGPWRSTVSIFN